MVTTSGFEDAVVSPLRALFKFLEIEAMVLMLETTPSGIEAQCQTAACVNERLEMRKAIERNNMMTIRREELRKGS